MSSILDSIRRDEKHAAHFSGGIQPRPEPSAYQADQHRWSLWSALVYLISATVMLVLLGGMTIAGKAWLATASSRSLESSETQQLASAGAAERGASQPGAGAGTGDQSELLIANTLPLRSLSSLDSSHQPPAVPGMVASLQPPSDSAARERYSWEPGPKAQSSGRVEKDLDQSTAAIESEHIRTALRKAMREVAAENVQQERDRPRTATDRQTQLQTATLDHAADRPSSARATSAAEVAELLSLEGTMAAGGRSMAIVGGQLVGVGDNVAGYEITEIGRGWICCAGVSGQIPSRSRKSGSGQAISLRMHDK